MSRALTPAGYREKAQRAIDGARLLLEAGDTEGACSRAYYAMYDAAHAALGAAGIETPDTGIKTHNGLLTLFGKELVQTNRIAANFNKALNQVQQLRPSADYAAEPPDMDKARWAVGQAEGFVAIVRSKFGLGP